MGFQKYHDLTSSENVLGRFSIPQELSIFKIYIDRANLKKVLINRISITYINFTIFILLYRNKKYGFDFQ